MTRNGASGSSIPQNRCKLKARSSRMIRNCSFDTSELGGVWRKESIKREVVAGGREHCNWNVCEEMAELSSK